MNGTTLKRRGVAKGDQFGAKSKRIRREECGACSTEREPLTVNVKPGGTNYSFTQGRRNGGGRPDGSEDNLRKRAMMVDEPLDLCCADIWVVGNKRGARGRGLVARGIGRRRGCALGAHLVVITDEFLSLGSISETLKEVVGDAVSVCPALIPGGVHARMNAAGDRVEGPA